MDDLEQKIQSVLSDPEQMQQVLNMARALGVSIPESEEPKAREQKTSPPEQNIPPQAGVDALSEPVSQLLQQAGKLEKRQENLLNALKPFLKPNRREKIDRAMQVARLSHLAGYALRSRGEKKT